MRGTSGENTMSDKKSIFVTVLDGVAEVDLDTVPEDVEVEIVDIDSLKVDEQYIRELSPAAQAYAKANGFV